MPRTTIIHPITIHDRSVTIKCPRCGDLHQYHAEELKPWPIRPGHERTVTAQCYRTDRRMAAAGNSNAANALTWGPGITNTFTIKFQRQEPTQ